MKKLKTLFVATFLVFGLVSNVYASEVNQTYDKTQPTTETEIVLPQLLTESAIANKESVTYDLGDGMSITLSPNPEHVRETRLNDKHNITISSIIEWKYFTDDDPWSGVDLQVQNLAGPGAMDAKVALNNGAQTTYIVNNIPVGYYGDFSFGMMSYNVYIRGWDQTGTFTVRAID